MSSCLSDLYQVENPTGHSLARLALYGIIGLAPLPILVYLFLALRGVYRVQVTVVDANKLPTHEAEVTASAGTKKQTDAGWEFDIAPQEKPEGNFVTFSASVRDRYLSGQSSLRLGANFFPDVKIELAPMQQVDVMGAVQTRDGKAAAGATVSVIGYSNQATTDVMGNFRLPSHAADGQMVTIRIQKGSLHGVFNVPAGKASIFTIAR